MNTTGSESPTAFDGKIPGFVLDSVHYPSPPLDPERIASTILEELPHGPGLQDLYVTTMAKSGTTWMLWVCYQVITRGKRVEDGFNIDDIYSWPQAGEEVQKLLMSKPMCFPRLLKAHTVVQHTPATSRTHLREGPDPLTTKFVYVCRDPVHSLVSYVAMKRALNPACPTAVGFVELFVSGQGWYGSWAEHVDGWYRESTCHPQRVLFVHFEDMKKDLSSVVLQLARFLNMPLDHEHSPEKGEEQENGEREIPEVVLQRILHHCSLEFMKTAGGGQAFQPRSLGGSASKSNKLPEFRFVGERKISRDVSTATETVHEQAQEHQANNKQKCDQDVSKCGRAALTLEQQQEVYHFCAQELANLSSPYCDIYSRRYGGEGAHRK